MNKSVLINEIGWMGTNASYADEWIELKNTGKEAVALDGWKLRAEDGSPDINLTGVVEPGGFFILERTDEATLPEVKAGLIYTGSLSNKGESLTLLNSAGEIVDRVEAEGGWPAGDNKSKESMERCEGGWQTSFEAGGTPGEENSHGLRIEKVETGGRPVILEETAWRRPANIRAAQTLLFGASCALICTGLTIIIKRKMIHE